MSQTGTDCHCHPLYYVEHCGLSIVAEPLVLLTFIRLHRSTTTHVDVAFCYRWSSVVCLWVVWSVCLSACHDSEPCKNGSADRDVI